MLTVEDGGRWFWYDAPGCIAATRWLGRQFLAAGVGCAQSAVLDTSGSIWAIDHDGPNFLRRVKLPGDVTLAALSPDGGLIACVVDDGKGAAGVWVCRGDGWARVSEPDFLCAVTDVRCAEDGASFGYAWRTSQPWSEWGSYGDRMAGTVVLDADGNPIREVWSERRHDDDRLRRILAWGPGGDPLVCSCAPDPTKTGATGETTVYTGGRTCPDPGWCTCPVGAPPREGGIGVELLFQDAVRAVVSRDGRRVGAVDREGTAWLLDIPTLRRCRVAEEALAMELMEPDLPGVVTVRGLWERFPVADDAGWETVGTWQE
jgi:hypothetical protein